MGITVDRNFPGGNIIVDGIERQTVRVHQDWSNSTDWWFYWALRICGAAGQKIRFDFGKEAPFSATGPCWSADGKHWTSLGREVIEGNGFSFAIPEKAEVGYLAFCVPYVLSHLEDFLAEHRAVARTVLTQDRSGAEVPLLTLAAREPRYQILFTVRHHACESLASYVLEGILDYAANSTEPAAEFIRKHVTLIAVPMVDFDGVQAGDQGKNRNPHDHNRDYTDEPLYPTVRAIKKIMHGELGKIDGFFDLHCPWIWDGRNEEVFIVGMPEEAQKAIDVYRELLAHNQESPLRYDPAQDCPFGTEWNVRDLNDLDDAGDYAFFKAGIPFSIAFEFAYGKAAGQVVTADKMRITGKDVGRALGLYYKKLG